MAIPPRAKPGGRLIWSNPSGVVLCPPGQCDLHEGVLFVTCAPILPYVIDCRASCRAHDRTGKSAPSPCGSESSRATRRASTPLMLLLHFQHIPSKPVYT